MNNKGSWNPYFAGALSGVVAIGSVWFVGKYFGASARGHSHCKRRRQIQRPKAA